MPRSSRRAAYIAASLPYGLWTCDNGREVLFNRHYEPIWQRKDGVVTPGSSEWIPFVGSLYFYDDSDRNARTLERRLEDVLDAFKCGRDLSGYAR